MANKYKKKCSVSLAIKEMQIKTTLRFHFTPVRMATIKKTTNAGEDSGAGLRKELLHAVGGNVN
jgi:hypothetical protein